MTGEIVQKWVVALARVLEVGVILVDSDQRAAFSNDAAAALLGCDSEEAVADAWGRIVPRVDDAMSRAKRDKVEVSMDLAPDDEQGHLRLEIHWIEGDFGEYLVILKNQALVEAVEASLAEASMMRGLARLFVSVAHELKAPLNAMTLNLELLDRQVQQSKRTPNGRKYIGLVKEELHRFERTLEDALNLTAIPEETSSRFAVADLLRTTAALLAPLARDQQVEIRLRLDEHPGIVVGSRDRLKQAVLNLLLNALEAMASGGGKLDIEMRVSATTVTVWIQDTGPGIPAERLPKIWDFHFTTKKSGSGIGLYVTRSIVTSLGGSVAIRSGPGEGACFELNLPLDREEAAPDV